MSLKDKLPFKIIHIELAKSYRDAKKIAQEYNAELPTMEQLGQLATYLYNYDGTIGAQQDISSGISLDTIKASQFLSVSPYSTYFYVWSGQESSGRNAYVREFYSDYTYAGGYNRNGNFVLAVCLRKTRAENVRDEFESDVKKWMEELNKRYEHNTITT